MDGLLAQLAAAERRAEQAEQAHQAIEQTRQITEQDLHLADLKIQKLTLVSMAAKNSPKVAK